MQTSLEHPPALVTKSLFHARLPTTIIGFLGPEHCHEGQMFHALVAEDEVLIREILCDELSDAGMHVMAYASGEDTIAAIESGLPIDLLFTDIHLAGSLNGWDLGHQARMLHPELRVIYATGGSEPPRELCAMERRIMKPFRFTSILEMLQEMGLAPA